MSLDRVGVKVRISPDQRAILFGDFAFFKLAAESTVNLIVFRDDDDARRVAVQSVDDARPELSGHVAELVKVKLQRAGHRSVIVASPRMHDHVGRFVENDQAVVFVKNLKRNVFGGK